MGLTTACRLSGTGEIHMGRPGKGEHDVEKPHRERWASSKAGETADQEARITGNQWGQGLKSQLSKGVKQHLRHWYIITRLLTLATA